MANWPRVPGALLVLAATLLAQSAPAISTQLDVATCTGATGQLWTPPSG